VANQAYYSLIGRDYEWELMPLGLDQGLGALVWSPLGWGRLTGRVRRGQPLPKSSRLHETAQYAPPIEDERLYRIVDALFEVAEETGRTVPQVAINWLLQRPTVASVLIGARDERQLRENLGAVGWSLSAEQVAKLDRVSAVTPPYPYYPYWNGMFAERSRIPLSRAAGRRRGAHRRAGLRPRWRSRQARPRPVVSRARARRAPRAPRPLSVPARTARAGRPPSHRRTPRHRCCAPD